MKNAKAPATIRQAAEQLLIVQHSNHEVVAKIAERFQLTQAQAWTAVHAAWERWDTEQLPTLLRRRRRHLETLGAIFRQAMADKAYGTAMKAMDSIADIEGFKAPLQLDVTTGRPEAPILTAAEQREALRMRLAERGMRLVPLEEQPALPPPVLDSKNGHGGNGHG